MTSTFVDTDHSARELVELLASIDEEGRHRPVRYLEALFDLRYDDPLPGSESTVRAVDFVDDNPRLHPSFDPARRGSLCLGPEECGSGGGCMPSPAGRACMPECGASTACGEGFECAFEPVSEPQPRQRRPSEPRYCQPARAP